MFCMHAALQRVMERKCRAGLTAAEATKLSIAIVTDLGTKLPLRNHPLLLLQLPVSARKVGQSVLYIQTRSNKYVKYILYVLANVCIILP